MATKAEAQTALDEARAKCVEVDGRIEELRDVLHSFIGQEIIDIIVANNATAEADIDVAIEYVDAT